MIGAIFVRSIRSIRDLFSRSQWFRTTPVELKHRTKWHLMAFPPCCQTLAGTGLEEHGLEPENHGKLASKGTRTRTAVQAKVCPVCFAQFSYCYALYENRLPRTPDTCWSSNYMCEDSSEQCSLNMYLCTSNKLPSISIFIFVLFLEEKAPFYA